MEEVETFPKFAVFPKSDALGSTSYHCTTIPCPAQAQLQVCWVPLLSLCVAL